MLVIVQNSDLVLLHRHSSHTSACQGLTLAVAPRSIARRRSADGNRSFMALIRLSGSLALVSSSSNTNKYLSVKATAVLASRGTPTLLCPGITTDGFNALIAFNEFNHFRLAWIPTPHLGTNKIAYWPKIRRSDLLPSQGTGVDARSTPAASNNGLCARFWKRTTISDSVIV